MIATLQIPACVVATALPLQLGSFPFWFSYAIVAAFWALAWLASALWARHRDSSSEGSLDSVLLLLGLSILGLTIGLLAGNSRNPAVEAAISAVLAVYGGFAGYLFTKDSRQGLVASLGLIGFAVCLEYGTQTGASFRVFGEDEARQSDLWYQEKLADYQASLDVWKATTIANAQSTPPAASPAPSVAPPAAPPSSTPPRRTSGTAASPPRAAPPRR